MTVPFAKVIEEGRLVHTVTIGGPVFLSIYRLRLSEFVAELHPFNRSWGLDATSEEEAIREGKRRAHARLQEWASLLRDSGLDEGKSRRLAVHLVPVPKSITKALSKESAVPAFLTCFEELRLLRQEAIQQFFRLYRRHPLESEMKHFMFDIMWEKIIVKM